MRFSVQGIYRILNGKLSRMVFTHEVGTEVSDNQTTEISDSKQRVRKRHTTTFHAVLCLLYAFNNKYNTERKIKLICYRRDIVNLRGS